MTGSSLIVQTDQIANVLRGLIRLKSGFVAMLPKDLARLKERLDELHPEGGHKRAIDYDLFYRIGLVLSHQREPLTMRELSEALAVPPSTATRMVDWLVDSGYAERLPDPEDRRVVRVILTKVGRELYRTIDGFIRHRIEQALCQFTPEERGELVSLLRRLMTALEGAVE